MLSEEVVPRFFERDADGVPRGWLEMMRHDLESIPPFFNTDRMVLEYAREAYLPLARQHAELSPERKARVKEIAREHQRIRKGFGELKIVAAHVADLAGLRVGDAVDVRLEVALGSLAPEDVAVELVLGHAKDERDLRHMAIVPLQHVRADAGAVHVFEGVHQMGRSGSYSYGIRVRARRDKPHADGLADLVLWA
jgi:starch phosphorylase